MAFALHLAAHSVGTQILPGLTAFLLAYSSPSQRSTHPGPAGATGAPNKALALPLLFWREAASTWMGTWGHHNI